MSDFEGGEVKSEPLLHESIVRFLKCFSLCSEIAIVGIIYLDRLVVRSDMSREGHEGEFCLTSANVHHALFGCLALATKFYNDQFETNTIFSAIIGCTRQKMRNIMNLILELIDFDLIVREEDYAAYENKLNKMIKDKFALKGQVCYFSKAERYHEQARLETERNSKHAQESFQDFFYAQRMASGSNELKLETTARFGGESSVVHLSLTPVEDKGNRLRAGTATANHVQQH